MLLFATLLCFHLFIAFHHVQSFIDPVSDVIESPDRRLVGILASQLWEEREWFVTSAFEQVRLAGGDTDVFLDVFVASVYDDVHNLYALSEDDVIDRLGADEMSANCPRCRVSCKNRTRVTFQINLRLLLSFRGLWERCRRQLHRVWPSTTSVTLQWRSARTSQCFSITTVTSFVTESSTTSDHTYLLDLTKTFHVYPNSV